MVIFDILHTWFTLDFWILAKALIIPIPEFDNLWKKYYYTWWGDHCFRGSCGHKEEYKEPKKNNLCKGKSFQITAESSNNA